MADQISTGGGQVTARHLAQMRLAADRAGLPVAMADLMAESGVTAASAEAAARGLREVVTMTAPFVAAGRLDEPAVARIAGEALRNAIASGGDTPLDERVRRVAADAAQAQMEAAEPPISRGGEARTTFAAPNGQRQELTVAQRMADGMLARMDAGHTPTYGREFAQMRLEDMARHGQPGFNRSAPTMVHSTSDFAFALAIASNKILLNAYEASGSQIKRVSREVPAPDFRPINAVQISTGMGLEPVGEAGEIKHGTIDDSGNAFQIETYAKIFGLSRRAYVNDDLGALANAARIQGTGAALTEAQLFAKLLTKNSGAGPTLSDTKALFHADHGNLAASSATLNSTSLSAARVALRRQKGISGEAIAVEPKFLVVPPELETQAQQLLSDVSATEVSQVNPFANKLELVVDAHLTSATRWYLAAAPGAPDGLLHAYLDGARGPQLFQREGWSVDAMEWKVRMDFGCGFVDHRAWYMNPGA